jgi:hypothetical protein
MSTVIVDGPSWEFSTTGIVFKSAVVFEAWESLGLTLSHIERGVRWSLGDWFLYGQGRPEWQQQLSQALSATGFNFHTLEVCRWVSSRIDQPRRRDDLSWSHHEAVARLDPEQQERWMDRAIGEGWSYRELRERIGAEVPFPGGPAGGRPTGEGHVVDSSSDVGTTPLDRLKSSYLALGLKARRSFRDWLVEQEQEVEAQVQV